ncbi:MAG: sigma 54-interacting transcriptional regulator [Polyangiaceae bacterium]
MSEGSGSVRPTRDAKGGLLRSAVAARLELTVEQEAGKPTTRTVVLDGELFRIGSHPSNDLIIDDPSVSRFHCRLVHERNVWRAIDTGSRNGTHIQGVRIHDAELPGTECVLRMGDRAVRVRELPAETPVELLDRPSLGELFGLSVTMRKLYALIERVASTDANVLIEGESGTGKELVATEIVRRGPRAQRPFVIVDCSSISPSLIESELFGHCRGAFTGADRERIGAFEAAHEGTVFLDELGELPLEMQPKLLRALEAREIRRVGETQTRKVDVRVVAATNRKLEQEVNSGRFREDLYYRLSVVTLRVPPLRERLEDIDILVRQFLVELDAQASAHLFPRELIDGMMRYDWPGNVRELRNYVERAIVLQQTEPNQWGAEARSPSQLPRSEPVDIHVQFRPSKERVVAIFERNYVTALLEWAQGNVSKAARKGGMDRMNLYRLMQRYGLRDARQLGEDHRDGNSTAPKA